jgi:hypothetical protein
VEVEAPEVDKKVRISFKIGSESGRVISKLINRQKDHYFQIHSYPSSFKANTLDLMQA